MVPPILAATGAHCQDRYAHFDISCTFLGEPQLRPNADIADTVVTANLAYDRFKNYAVRKDMVSAGRRLLSRPNALPHLDGSNGRPLSGISIPMLRVVAMDGSAGGLSSSQQRSKRLPRASSAIDGTESSESPEISSIA
ncbi:MAG TPA: hypothetical protein VED02_02145 [Methyloceanibacter sp.]|nr:hypothetical protein [Methyloceanibacter sp.]